MNKTRVLAAFRRAKRYLRQGWCKNALAQTRTGRECTVTSIHAVEWCPRGAIQRAAADLAFRDDRLLRQMLLVVSEVGSRRHIFLPEWNDWAWRTKEEVITFLDECINAIREKEKAT